MKAAEPIQHDWVMPILGIVIALTIAIGLGFLAGQQTPSPPDDMSAVCRALKQSGVTSDCIALRSAVANEGATSAARWALWLAFGSLIAGTFALIGLMVAYSEGRRTITLATEANRIAMENGQAQARAYVVVQSVECRLDEHGQIAARVKFRNSGLSPARRLRWLYNAHLTVVEREDKQRELTLGDEPDLEKSHWRQDIPSADSWKSGALALRRVSDPEIIASIKQAVFLAVTVKVVADYQDVFGTTHREIACFQGRAVLGTSEKNYSELERAHDGVFDQQTKRIGT